MQVHTPSRHDSFAYPARHPIRAELAFAATSVCGRAIETPASAPLAETPPEEIPPCREANWSVRDFPRADALARLPVNRRTVFGQIALATRAYFLGSTGTPACAVYANADARVRRGARVQRSQRQMSTGRNACATKSGAEIFSGRIVSALRLRGAEIVWLATWDPLR